MCFRLALLLMIVISASNGMKAKLGLQYLNGQGS